MTDTHTTETPAPSESDDPASSPPPEPTGTSYAWLRLGAMGALLLWLGISSPWMLVVVLALIVMITLHELGHYLTAKRAGMKVTEFFLGFGPRLWSTRRGETEYGIKLIPAGAYVKIPGMVNIDEVAPEDEPRTYRQKSFGQRVSVAVAGSAMHFMLALVLIYVALVAIGQPGGSLTSKPAARPTLIDEVVPGSGADGAGLQPGDRVTSIDGKPTPTSKELIAVVAPRKGSSVPITYVRDGSTRSATADLREYTFKDDDGSTVRACGMGIVMAAVPNERVNPAAGLIETPKQFGQLAWMSIKGLGSFFSPSGITDFAGQVGDAQGASSSKKETEKKVSEDPCGAGAAATSASASSSGENRILSIYGLVRIGSSVGGVDPAGLIALFALINIFIGMFNLVPLLPFDGGHVAIAVYERIQEKRLHRRRYFTDVSRLLPVTYVVVLLLGMLFVSSLYLDIVNPIGG